MIDNTAFEALKLSFVAGMAPMCAMFLVYVPQKHHQKALILSSSFAAGVMLFISLGELLSNSMDIFTSGYGTGGAFVCMLIFSAGFMIMNMADRIPDRIYYEKSSSNNPDMKKGLLFLIAITLHNFPEGMATFSAALENLEFGRNIALAIALHNIPEGMVVVSNVYYSSADKKKAFFYALLSSVAEPLGALCAYIFFYKYLSGLFMGAVFSFIAGIMMYICAEEMSVNYGEGTQVLKNYLILTGICFMCIVNAL